MEKEIKWFVFLILLFALTACGPGQKKEDNRTVFKYNESSGIATLDPAFAKDQAHIWACYQLYNGLVQLDEKLLVKPCIASDWEVSEDGLTYTFFLRDDVCFHDHELFPEGQGRRVLASDFEYSFKRIVDPSVASTGAWVFNAVDDSNGVYAFDALNDTTFRIRLKQSFPPFLGLLSMPYGSVLPQEVVEHYGKDYRNHPVGTGPFRFKYWKEGVKLVFVKNPEYWEYDGDRQLPFLDAVAVTFVMDKQTAFLEFIKGNLDFMSGIDASYKDELLSPAGKLNPKYTEDIRLQTEAYLNTEYLGILVDPSIEKFSDSPLRKKKIRQAINYGFDRHKMMRFLRNNIGTPGTHGFIPKGLPAFDSSANYGYDYNPEKARALLAEAGFPNGKGLPDITLSTTSSYLDLCKYIQHELSEIGIPLKIDVNHPGTLRNMISKSEVVFFRGSWIADYPDAENYLALFYSPNFCPKGSNYTHFSHPDFDALYEKANAEPVDSTRRIYYRQMDSLIMEEAPLVVLYYDQVLRFSQKNIEGLGSNPINLLDLKRVKKGNK